MSDSAYGLTTFSSGGKLPQIEYAMKAVANGALTLGIKGQDSVVLAANKKTQALVDSTSVNKVFVLDEHVGSTYSGMGPDNRPLVDKARKICQHYKRVYLEPIPIGQLVREIASIFQEFTQSGGVRPFGVSMLIAGVDTTGPHLYQVDPSGTFYPWKATAIGNNYSDARTFLERRDTNDLDQEGAINNALLALKQSFSGTLSPDNTVVGVVNVASGKFEVMPAADLRDHLEQIAE